MEIPEGAIPAHPLEYWASLGNLAQVRRELKRGADVNQEGANGYTALHGAAENARFEIAELLLEEGGNVNARLISGETLLDLARAQDRPDMVELLRRHGGKPGT